MTDDWEAHTGQCGACGELLYDNETIDQHAPMCPAAPMSAILPAPTIRVDQVYTWESQVKQYTKTGLPGIRHEAHDVPVGDDRSAHVEVLLYRNHRGHVVGILTHYPDDVVDFDGTQLEKAGNVNVWVRPDRQRRGIGRRLVAEAVRRWNPPFEQQRYTEAGHALAASYLDHPGDDTT